MILVKVGEPSPRWDSYDPSLNSSSLQIDLDIVEEAREQACIRQVIDFPMLWVAQGQPRSILSRTHVLILTMPATPHQPNFLRQSPNIRSLPTDGLHDRVLKCRSYGWNVDQLPTTIANGSCSIPPKMTREHERRYPLERAVKTNGFVPPGHSISNNSAQLEL
ncbi:hypothetical protein CR513_53844, partial [Mucuna pruriens]